MLKPYKYLPGHKIERLHDFVGEIVGIWSGALSGSQFELSMLSTELKVIVERERDNKAVRVANGNTGHDYLFEPIVEIYDLVKENSTAKSLILQCFERNNEIVRLCDNDHLIPIWYKEIEPPELRLKIRSFCDNLYNEVLRRGEVLALCGEQVTHFKELSIASGLTVCPFCGIYDLKPIFSDKRNAYDHYFSKSRYPFTSVNFKNLFPICEECNSTSYKGSNDIIYVGNKKDERHRKKAFFPFSDTIPEITVSFGLESEPDSWQDLTPENILLSVECAEEDRKEQWVSVFGIGTRYPEKVCQKIKEWIKVLLDHFTVVRMLTPTASLEEFIAGQLLVWQDNSLSDQNFLKYAIFSCLLEEGGFSESIAENWSGGPEVAI